jgi:predicted O-methyltransferase YrrM
VSLGVFVLGMHRSGTSAATRLVNLLGVPTCVDEDLSPARADNPRGYWESESLTVFNERLLDALGCDWSCPPRLEQGWENDSALEQLVAEAAVVFPTIFPTEQWVWKDPRNSIVLPFWRRVLDVQLVAILVLRNPLEVAASLEARNGLGKTYSLALWERSLRVALGDLSDVPTLVTRFEDLLADPAAWSRGAADFLRPAGISVAPVRDDEADAFVDGGLRHAEATAEDLERDQAVSAPQAELSRMLEAMRGVHPAGLVAPALGPETGTTEALLAERRHAYALKRRYLELEHYARTVGERIVALERQAHAHESVSAEFVPPGHFYSAIPDFLDVEARRAEIFEQDPLDVPGVDLRLDAQLALLEELTPLLADVPFADHPQAGLRYHYRNGMFEHADGLFLHLLLRRLQPARVIEVGSGFSSACILDTVDRFLERTSCTFIEPNPDVLNTVLIPEDDDRIELLAQRVQSVPVSVFQELAAGDLLLIDSTHVSKAGSDVNHLFFHVLPTLATGTLVHFHDVFPGFEYPLEWLRARRAWSENYLLRGFLQFNDAFEIVLWPRLLFDVRPLELSRFRMALENPGGSIYLRRIR